MSQVIASVHAITGGITVLHLIFMIHNRLCSACFSFYFFNSVITSITSMLLSSLFSFGLIHEVEVLLVEGVHSHIAIFTATSITDTLRMYRDSVERTKMAPHPTDLVFEDFMIEAGFEFALTSTGSSDGHGILPTTYYDEVLSGCDGSGIQRLVCRVRLQHLQVGSCDKLRTSVTGWTIDVGNLPWLFCLYQQ